jgi:hypothetical protein
MGALSLDELETFTTEWRKVLHEANYLAPGWPQEYGGAGLSALEQVILAVQRAFACLVLGDVRCYV